MKQSNIDILKQFSDDEDLKYFTESLCPKETKPKGYWTLERCKADALKYNTRNEWRKGKNSAYQSACINGWLDICCGHMNSQETKSRGYWTLERCKEDALLYSTVGEWRKNSSGAYNSAYINGWLDICCKHMNSKETKPSGYWTLERCKKDALHYITRGEWRKNSKSSYNRACKSNWLDICCAHMKILT